MYVNEKTSFFVDRQRSMDILMNYINASETTEEFSLVAKDMEKIKPSELKSNIPLIVVGDEGSGSKWFFLKKKLYFLFKFLSYVRWIKESALMAQLTKKLLEVSF